MGATVKLIVENSLRVLEDGYAFDVRLNWYRSLPLSSVDVLYLKVNGEQVLADQIFFEINNHSYSQKELLEQFDEFWFVQDHARLHVRQPGKIHQGESHTIETEISLRFPYMSIGPGKFLTIATRYASSQIAQ
jgi:hypothetical protein